MQNSGSGPLSKKRLLNIAPLKLAENQFSLSEALRRNDLPETMSFVPGVAIGQELFAKVRDLAKGAEGEVIEATYLPSKFNVALKRVFIPNEEVMRLVLNEVRALQTAVHANIVACLGYFVASPHVYIVQELMELGTLRQLVGRRLPEKVLSYIMREMLSGLQFLHHTLKLIHRDLKPENILINRRGEVKISDFGISKKIDMTDNLVLTFVGSKFYMSPERIEGRQHGILSDVWAVGVILFELALGRNPYTDPQPQSIVDLVDLIKHKRMVPFPPHFSPELCNFINKTLNIDPLYRIRTTVLLNDRFITDHVGFTAKDFLNYLSNEIKN